MENAQPDPIIITDLTNASLNEKADPVKQPEEKKVVSQINF